MSLYSAFGIVLTVSGLVFSILQVFSPKTIRSFLTSPKKLSPFISIFPSRRFVILLMSSILLSSLVILITFTLSSTSGKNPSAITPAQYTTYQSNSDVQGFTTHITWDIAPVMQHSLSIALDMRQNSNARAITQLSQKFGHSYTFFMVAQLDADSSTFTDTPKEQMQEQIDQGDLSFHWVATPLHTGDQAVDIIVKGIWVPQDNSKKQIEYYLGSHTWHIKIVDDNLPLIIFGQINVSSVLGYAGSVLVSVAFLELVKNYVESRKKAKQQENNTQAGEQSQQPSSTP